jgi:competence protein ComEA
MDKDKIRFYLQEYFTFSRGEKVGILVLITLIILILVGYYLLPLFIPSNPKIDVSEFEKQIARFEQASDSLSLKGNNNSLKSAKGAIKYVNCVKPKQKPKQIIKVDLNTADSASLEQLPGIGPVFAGRIIKYRTMLGGYYSIKQLNEVYGMKPEILAKVRPYLTTDTLIIRTIDLNHASFKEINAHPYISFQQTKLVMKSRVQDEIISLRQLEEAGIFTKEELKKLQPYLLPKY